MQYCFIDESGNPSLRDKKPFIVAVVILDSLSKVEQMKQMIMEFKRQNNIPQDYEFHYSRNAKTKKNLFMLFVERHFKKYKTFVVTKKNSKDSLMEVADMIACYLNNDTKYRIIMDSNPNLFKAIKNSLRERGIVAKISQEKSTNNVLIQVADYIAGVASSGLKLEKLP